MSKIYLKNGENNQDSEIKTVRSRAKFKWKYWDRTKRFSRELCGMVCGIKSGLGVTDSLGTYLTNPFSGWRLVQRRIETVEMTTPVTLVAKEQILVVFRQFTAERIKSVLDRKKCAQKFATAIMRARPAPEHSDTYMRQDLQSGHCQSYLRISVTIVGVTLIQAAEKTILF